MRFILPLLLISLVANAQEAPINYQITPKGLINGVQPDQQYTVITYSGKSQADLYKVFLVAINKSYVSPKDVISKVEGESISINAISNATIRTKAKAGLPYKASIPYKLSYVLNIAFKDERVRIDIPTIIKMVNDKASNGDWYLEISGKKRYLQDTPIYIYDENGKLLESGAKKEIEDAVNEVVKNLLRAVDEQIKGW